MLDIYVQLNVKMMIMIERIKNWTIRIPYWVNDLLSFITAIICLFTTAFSGLRLLFSGTEKEVDSLIKVIILCLVGVILIMFIKMRKYKRIIVNLRSEFSEGYYSLLHDFRNIYYEMLKHYKITGVGDKKMQMELIGKDTRQFLVAALDSLSRIFAQNTGCEVSCCVKLIETNGVNAKINADNAKVYTFCRSKNTDQERLMRDEGEYRSALIRDNTDFYEILLNDLPIFYQGNLRQYAADLRKVGKSYNNSRADYDKYYIGTIVAPIRLKKEFQHFDKNTEGYDLIGFLCVDTLSENAFRNDDDHRKNYSFIVKAYADEMYVILKQYSYFLESIQWGKNKNA